MSEKSAIAYGPLPELDDNEAWLKEEELINAIWEAAWYAVKSHCDKD